ncbi:hypothetical protein LKD28_13225 [Coprococcus sp. CLA-AA-H212]|jgi:hypothetical protein|uniref:Uncharacterized protein n=1 Tax=Coprococcus hominis (ex Arizal et al. 2022) TaxID=2881262 RepID=A0ABS8FTC1_9FIRM|nr:hypothetical protein [Coprococcus hominis (ex Arizal et al. 2022)]MCC2219969.1 hypothetical protein [Coprococcus hominis (ex Arizal et al. 2022)]
MAIVVNYSVIDTEIKRLNAMLDDTYVHIAAGRLGTEISYSQSDYVNILMDEVYILKDIQNIVHGIIEDSVKMLNIAKKIYQDGDIQISDMLSEGK